MTNFIVKIADVLEEKFLPFASALSNQRHLAALRDGFIATMPISMFGALVVMLKEVIFQEGSLFGLKLNTISFYAEQIQPFLNKTIVPVMNQIWWGSLALGIIFTVLTVAYKLAEQSKQDALSSGVIAVVAYLTLLPQMAPGGEWGTISWTSFNSESIFAGLIVAFVSAELFIYINRKGWVFKMPAQVPPAVSRAFSAIIPAGVILTLFSTIGVVFIEGFGTTLQAFINNAIQVPLTSLGQSPITLLILVLVAQVLWFFGLHGSTIIGPVLDTMYSAALGANAEAIMIHGTKAPNVITRNIIDIYGMYGGSGSTLALIVAILIFSKRQESLMLSKMSLGPGVFQINEPMIYGLPIVLNPIYAIPFILTPPITTMIGYFFTSIGVAGAVYIAPPWVTPPIISAFLATGGDIGATLVAAGLFALTIAIYAPFVIIANKVD